MDKEQKKQQTSENTKLTDPDLRESKEEFNTGGNDSDYDGGHPEDVKPDSEGRIGSKDES